MKVFLSVLVNKIITKILKLLRRNGSQLPGSIVLDYICGDILTRIKYPKYVIAVSGSSGKGSTCVLVKHILEENGYSVAFNEYGSNGVIGATTLILNNSTLFGRFKKDVLLLECDERHLKLVFTKNKPTHLIITNITRDQPCRHGNHNYVFADVCKAIGKNTTLIINGDDPKVSTLKYTRRNKIITYGVDKTKDSYKRIKLNAVDHVYCPMCHTKLNYDYYHYYHIGSFTCPFCDFKRGDLDYVATNVDFKNHSLRINDETYYLNKDVLYAAYYTTAAVAICNTIGLDKDKVKESIDNFKLQDNRGKIVSLDNREVYMLESKSENNASFYQSIKFIANQEGKKTLVIGFDYVSKRHPHNDVSWLWDIEFELLEDADVDKVFCIGKFRYDVAARMNFSGIPKNKIVLVDNIDDVVKHIKNESKGTIYTMNCIECTKRILDLIEDEENEKN